VLVDVTADWCINCKYNKSFVFDSSEVMSFLEANNIVLLRADITRKDSYSKEIRQYMLTLGAHGIPLNILYKADRDAKILPTMLTKNDILLMLD
jgi:suppressor for copper-sensitivity B